MRAIVQRVSRSEVVVDGEVRGRIGQGFMVLLGVGEDDGDAEAKAVAAKIAKLRVFVDDAGKMNRSLADVGGSVLVISQFTLYADVAGGNRPSFIRAARPEPAVRLYELFCDELRAGGIPVEKGVFGAHMDVSLVNDGPVTIIVDSDMLKR